MSAKVCNFMASLQNLISLVGDENSKVFIVNEQGDLKAVMLGLAEYQRLLGAKLQRAIEDVEKINREIVQAQLSEEAPGETPLAAPVAAPESIGELLSKKADLLFRSAPGPRVQEDLRSEVIDPNFDFTTPPAETDDEVIRPSFDDI